MPAEGEMRAPQSDLLHSELPSIAADILARLRQRAPRVHCITNSVAQNFTANVLLAMGATPSMTISREEIAAFVGGADALLVNLGTFDAERRVAVDIAVKTASESRLPWVLDPVFVDRAPPRAAFAKELIGKGPAVVRLNAREFFALAGGEAKNATVAVYALEHKLTVALSGETDFVADGSRQASLANGHPWMARVTAMGCAGSALNAACLAVEKDAWRASVAVLLILGVAGEVAAANSKGPGSFAAAIIDALFNLDGVTLIQRAKVK